MSPLFPVVLFLCAAGAFCALPQDSNNFVDTVLRDRFPAEIRTWNLDPAQIPDFSVKVKKTFVTNRDLKADFTSGKVFGLSQVRRRGDCGAPFWEGSNSTLRCHLSLDGIRIAYQVRAKGHKAFGSTTYSVDMFVENTNFIVEVTSARTYKAVVRSVNLQSLSLKINESSGLGLNKDRKKKYHDAITSNVQSQLTGLLYGGFRDALNRAVNTATVQFPFL